MLFSFSSSPRSESGYEKPFPGIKDSWFSIGEDALVKDKPVHVWVKAYSGNSSCQSKKVSVILRHAGQAPPTSFQQEEPDEINNKKAVRLCSAVKYDAPNVSVSWLKRDLVLGWPAAEASPAVAQVRLRMHQRPWDPWENVRRILSPNFKQLEENSPMFLCCCCCCRERPTPASKIQHVSGQIQPLYLPFNVCLFCFL